LVQGKSNPWAFEAKVNLLKCLELAVKTLEENDSFDDFIDSVRKEIEIAIEMAVANTNILQAAVPKISPNPYISATVEGCIEKSLDITEGGAIYNNSAVCATGVADTVDSLCAVKKIVFEDELVKKRDLLKALKNNFEDFERLRYMLINRAPKFGNDLEYADNLAATLVEYISHLVTKHKNPRGGNYILGLFSYGDYIGHGLTIGATPNGRKKGEGISPNFSPSPGRDIKGPFAVLKSINRINNLLTANGTALDLTLHPSTFSGEDGATKMIGFLKSFIQLDVMQVQFNIVDTEKLKAAQSEPGKYQNLTVRLWGFPAYFTRLPKEFQDHLINRAEHAF
jgi:formate C-acetyltransferase